MVKYCAMCGQTLREERSYNNEISILGTPYRVYTDVTEQDKPMMKDADGLTDFTTKEIFIAPMKADPDSMQDLEHYERRTIRHEIIHAMLFESGLDANTDWARNEEIVDWIAIQFPKIAEAFKGMAVEEF